MNCKWFALGLLIAIPAAPSAGESLETAKLFYANRLYVEAKRELIAVATGGDSNETRAEALNLLGEIAVEEENYEAAVSSWSEVASKYPETRAATEAAARLPLARKLAASRGEKLSVEVTAETPASELLEPGTVLLVGSAPEAPEFADQAVLEFMNLLTSRGVRAQDAFAGRKVLPGMTRTEAFSLPNWLAYAREVRAASVLYVFLHFHGVENMRVECYGPDGSKLWSEKVTASLGLGPSGMTAGFVRRMSPKIIKHIGQSGLPTSAP